MLSKKVFVYGTLKQSNSVRGLNKFPGATFVDQAVTNDATYSLYDLGAFPAVSIKGQQRILGEVWEVDDNTFEVLDSIEGYPHFYNRTQVDTSAGKAWMYYIPGIEQEAGTTQILSESDTVGW